MAQSKQKKTQLKTSDRGGMARLIFGALFLALGIGWLMAILMNTVSAWNSLSLLRDTAHGLGGVLCSLLPFFAIAGGTLLCASARKRVSWRAFFAALGMYICILGILTLGSRVSGRETMLMDYIANSNKTVLGIINNTTYGAYLTGAYNLRGFNNGMLAGGGLLGMLVAYPLYVVFKGIGGITILVMLALAFFLVMFRINPMEIISAVGQRSYERRQEKKTAANQTPPPAQAPPPPMYEPAPAEPLIRPQTVTYTTTSVQSDPEPSYLVKDDVPMYAQAETPEARGFVPVETGELYTEHIPVGDDYQPEPVYTPEPAQRKRRSERQPKAQETVKPAAPPAEEVEVLWQPENTPPVAPVAPVETKVKAAPPEPPQEEKQPSSRLSFGSHHSDEPRQVFTDPAVPLTGERIPISPAADTARPDPLVQKHTAAAIRAVDGVYTFPPLSLLRDPKRENIDTHEEDNARARMLEHTLTSFNIDARVDSVVHGPAITRFALKLADGVNVNKINTVSNNLALAMKAVGLRIEIPITGTSLVGIEVPNQKVRMITLKEILDSPAMRANHSPTTVALGASITGEAIMCELSDMPHLLIAGATGSGKSVCINSIIQSLLFRATPQQVRLLMIDPKMVELQPYNGIPHLLTEVVSEPKKAAAALDWAVQEMQDRYRRFRKVGARSIANYNDKIKNEQERMPQIVLIIDEFYDLMAQCRKEVEESIQRLAALARAAGIYMIVATQRPSVDVITGVIKANIPSRIAFAVSTNVDSRTIIDSNGAEKLLGKGDMLYFPRSEFHPIRVQGCFVSDDEVQQIADFIKENNEAAYDTQIDDHIERTAAKEEAPRGKEKEKDYEYQADTENELLQRAIEMAVESGQMSISMLRRRLGLGHSRAGKLIDRMAQMGIVSQDEGPKPRRTLITREDYIKMQAEILDE